MTPAELQLFIEGSEAIGRVELSPPLLTLSGFATNRTSCIDRCGNGVVYRR
jgi:hypothetical protein